MKTKSKNIKLFCYSKVIKCFFGNKELLALLSHNSENMIFEIGQHTKLDKLFLSIMT